jgi:tRNA A22 N-methylase
VKNKWCILFIKKQEKSFKMVTFESEMKQGRFAPFLRKKSNDSIKEKLKWKKQQLCQKKAKQKAQPTIPQTTFKV